MSTTTTSTSTSTTATATANEQTTLLTLSSEKIERARGLVATLTQELTSGNILGSSSLLVGRLYPQCKSFANLVESVSRDKNIKPSEIHKIDLRNGKVVRKKKITNSNGKAKRKNKK